MVRTACPDARTAAAWLPCDWARVSRPLRRQVIPIGESMVVARRSNDPEFIGSYRVLARLGSGGFGIVYAARATNRDGTLVAVKQVYAHVLEQVPDLRDRFRREIGAIKRVKSDFVPAFMNADADAALPWVATELVPGLSLAEIFKRRKQSLPEAAVWWLGAKISQGLTDIHSAKCLHRDLTPANVLLVPDRPWIIDFGLARLAELPPSSLSLRQQLATFEYAAPEQLDGLGNATEPPADIFGLGGTLLHAATGHPPHPYSMGHPRSAAELPNLESLPHGKLRFLIESCLRHTENDRPSLDELRATFANQAARVGGGDGDAAVLPPDVIALLTRFQDKLAEVLDVRGPARLGWTRPARSARRVAGPDGIGSLLRAPVVPSSQSEPASRPAPGPSPELSAAGAAVPGRYTGSPRQGVVLPSPPPSAEGWPRQFGAWICGPVAVHGGACVVTCRDGRVWAVTAKGGTDMWPEPARLGGPVNGAAVILPDGPGSGAAAVVAAADGSVHAIDLLSGSAPQILPPGPAIEGSPVVVRDVEALQTLVYVVRSDGSVYRIDPGKSYHLLHKLAGGSTGAMAATPGALAVADARGTVHVLDPQDGRRITAVRTKGQVFGAPVLAAGHVYVASTDGQLHTALISDTRDAADGEHHHFGLGAPVHAAPVWHAGRLYVGGSDGFVYAYDVPGSGGAWLDPRRFSEPLGAEIAGLAVAEAAEDRGEEERRSVFVAVGYHVVKLDGQTGSLRHVLTMNCLVGAAPVISRGFCYAVGLGGTVERAPLR
jgi:serine/threonine protein kinase/outer membrane protein assembly factor BamB